MFISGCFRNPSPPSKAITVDPDATQLDLCIARLDVVCSKTLDNVFSLIAAHRRDIGECRDQLPLCSSPWTCTSEKARRPPHPSPLPIPTVRLRCRVHADVSKLNNDSSAAHCSRRARFQTSYSCSAAEHTEDIRSRDPHGEAASQRSRIGRGWIIFPDQSRSFPDKVQWGKTTVQVQSETFDSI